MSNFDKIEVVSRRPPCVVANYDTNNLEFCNIVYMCIKEAGFSDYQIPENMRGLVEQVLSDIHHLSPNLIKEELEKYCYITIKKMFVQPNTTGNREGWHIDGFKSDQENFIWSDSDSLPTEVSIGVFNLTHDHQISIDEMMIQSTNNCSLQLKPNCLYYLDRECVHRATANKTENTVLRTFIKVTFSKELFNCLGNAWNYKLPHIKPNKTRLDSRNHGVIY